MPDTTRLDEIVKDCLFREGESTDNAVTVEGVVRNFGFHPDRLQSHRAEIAAQLSELPTEFLSETQGGGGGWSFLNACNDHEGNQWTGEQATMEVLFCLGMGLGMVQCLLPREMWSALPGGVPYYGVDTAA